MTGEQIKSDLTAEEFPLHFAIAAAFGGTVEPFDVYQGPYVLIGEDVRAGDGPYAVAVQGLGVVRLWLCTEDGAFGTVYNEATEQSSAEFPLNGAMAAVWAVAAAEQVIA